tara:strand:- start:1339 stop:1650 length:312 start_codon:yes stop_codon:yes gene_type:complete
MAIADEIADGLSELETDFPATFVWQTTTYDAIASGESRNVTSGEFGLEQDDELSLVVRLAQFGTGTKPTQRARLTYNGRYYRIEEIIKAPNEAFVIYRCIRNR